MDEIQFVATTCWFVEAHANFCFCFLHIIFKGGNSADVIFMKNTFKIVPCQNTCEPICFKLGMMLYTTELYCLIPV